MTGFMHLLALLTCDLAVLYSKAQLALLRMCSSVDVVYSNAVSWL